MTEAAVILKGVQITTTLIQLLMAKQKAETVLAQGHKEGWAESDPRWAGAFAEADASLAAAQARL